MACLYRIRPDGTALERWDVKDDPLVVGRGHSACASVEDDALSRSHFLIVRENADFFLIDLNSRNGTWVGNRQVSAWKLRSPEIIVAGESIFFFSAESVSTTGVAAELEAANA